MGFLDIFQEVHRKRQLANKAATARKFNNRFCYAERYVEEDKFIPGVGVGGSRLRGGYRWMCPGCNALHAPMRHTAFVGLIYPACCAHREGSRYETLGKNGLLKRPLGWAGPDGLYRKLRLAGIDKE